MPNSSDAHVGLKGSRKWNCPWPHRLLKKNKRQASKWSKSAQYSASVTPAGEPLFAGCGCVYLYLDGNKRRLKWSASSNKTAVSAVFHAAAAWLHPSVQKAETALHLKLWGHLCRFETFYIKLPSGVWSLSWHSHLLSQLLSSHSTCWPLCKCDLMFVPLLLLLHIF